MGAVSRASKAIGEKWRRTFGTVGSLQRGMDVPDQGSLGAGLGYLPFFESVGL